MWDGFGLGVLPFGRGLFRPRHWVSRCLSSRAARLVTLHGSLGAVLSERLLEFLTQKFNDDVTDECGYKSDHQIGLRHDIVDRPNETLTLSHTCALELPHQEIGVKQEHYEAGLDDRSPHPFHPRTLDCRSERDNGVRGDR